MSDQRVILVTGANKGIGYEAVKYLSQQVPDAVVYLASRSVDNGNAAVTKMQESVPGHSFSNVKVVELDITKQASLDAAVETVRSEHGKLTDLLHNSGIASFDSDPNSPDVLEVNVRGARNTIETFLPIIPAKTGKIVLVSSEVGAWYTATVEPATRDKLEDVGANDWNKVESYMKDWVAHSKGEPASVAWPPADNMLTQAYCASKALVTAWARNFASTHTDTPLAIVCPGYCATDLNANSGFRPASVGGESVAWPLLNKFENGHFYQDGKDLPYVFAMPKGFLEQGK